MKKLGLFAVLLSLGMFIGCAGETATTPTDKPANGNGNGNGHDHADGEHADHDDTHADSDKPADKPADAPADGGPAIGADDPVVQPDPLGGTDEPVATPPPAPSIELDPKVGTPDADKKPE